MITGILVPGAAYPAEGTLLDLGGALLEQRGHAVEKIAWTVPDGLRHAGPEPFVRAHVLAALHRVRQRTPGARPVLVAKSLGTWSSALAAELALPAVWLTPVLTDDGVAAGITANTAPSLLVGGTADRMWLSGRGGAHTVVEIPGADHSLRVPGPVSGYLGVLGRVVTAMEVWLDEVTATG